MPRTRNDIVAIAYVAVAVKASGDLVASLLYVPPIKHVKHVPSKVEAIAARMLRAAIDAGAREV